ncbi:hypothetical protein TNIN_9181 [Trichonephila inaurata madagascariensis]|uniref:Uncharacterized protein n=1 Tax=Trichonephila inaurata madagascariensis TaxID=2747483 RepID=A0A8X6I2I8_9ARAC|nr:hypothetical protein TNIN_9181 [Trichonephila inaurata madagascariensis]
MRMIGLPVSTPTPTDHLPRQSRTQHVKEDRSPQTVGHARAHGSLSGVFRSEQSPYARLHIEPGKRDRAHGGCNYGFCKTDGAGMSPNMRRLLSAYGAVCLTPVLRGCIFT